MVTMAEVVIDLLSQYIEKINLLWQSDNRRALSQLRQEYESVLQSCALNLCLEIEKYNMLDVRLADYSVSKCAPDGRAQYVINRLATQSAQSAWPALYVPCERGYEVLAQEWVMPVAHAVLELVTDGAGGNGESTTS